MASIPFRKGKRQVILKFLMLARGEVQKDAIIATGLWFSEKKRGCITK